MRKFECNGWIVIAFINKGLYISLPPFSLYSNKLFLLISQMLM